MGAVWLLLVLSVAYSVQYWSLCTRDTTIGAWPRVLGLWVGTFSLLLVVCSSRIFTFTTHGPHDYFNPVFAWVTVSLTLVCLQTRSLARSCLKRGTPDQISVSDLRA